MSSIKISIKCFIKQNTFFINFVIFLIKFAEIELKKVRPSFFKPYKNSIAYKIYLPFYRNCEYS